MCAYIHAYRLRPHMHGCLGSLPCGSHSECMPKHPRTNHDADQQQPDWFMHVSSHVLACCLCARVCLQLLSHIMGLKLSVLPDAASHHGSGQQY